MDNPFEFREAEGFSLRCQAVLVGGTGRRKDIGAWLDLATPKTIDSPSARSERASDVDRHSSTLGSWDTFSEGSSQLGVRLSSLGESDS